MYYNRSSSSIAKVILLSSIFGFRGTIVSDESLTPGLVNLFVVMQMCMFLPSLLVPVKDWNLTSFFIGETLLMLGGVYIGLSTLPTQYVNGYTVFIVLHIVSCQVQALSDNNFLLSGAGEYFGMHWLHIYLMFLGTGLCISIVTNSYVSCTPEIAMSMFCGEIVGVFVSVASSILSFVSVKYENVANLGNMT